MGAAVALRDVVGEAQNVFVVAVGPLQGELHGEPFALGPEHHRRLHQRRLGAVEIAHEGLEAALVAHLDLARLGVAVVAQDQADAGIEERQFAQAVLQGIEVEIRHGEGLARRQEGHLRAGAPVALRDRRQRLLGLAVGKAHEMRLALAEDAQLEPLGEGIDHRDADPVQPAGHLVGVLVEFPAGMQLGHDDLGRRNAFLGVDIDRNAAPVVAHGDRAVAVQHHLDGIAEAGQRLVDRVVHHLVDHVVQAGAVLGIANIHAGALAHRLEAAQDPDGLGAVLRARRLLGILIEVLFARGFSHFLPVA